MTQSRIDFSNYLRNHNPPKEGEAPPPAAPPKENQPTQAEIDAAIEKSRAAAAKMREESNAAEAARIAADTTPATPAPAAAASPPPPPPVVVQPGATAPDPTLLAMSEEVRQLRDSAKKNEEATKKLLKAIADEKLETYRQSVLAAYAGAGIKLAPQYVYGRTNEEIDTTAKLAYDEHIRIASEERAKIEKENADKTAAAAAAPRVPGTPPAPPPPVTGLPTHTDPAAAGGVGPRAAGSGSPLTDEEYNYLKSHAAVRNGDYQKYRELVAAHVASKFVQPNLPAPPIPGSFSHGMPGQQATPQQHMGGQPANAPPTFGIRQLSLGGVTQMNPAGIGAPPQPQLQSQQQYQGASSTPTFQPAAGNPMAGAPVGGNNWSAIRSSIAAKHGLPTVLPTTTTDQNERVIGPLGCSLAMENR